MIEVWVPIRAGGTSVVAQVDRLSRDFAELNRLGIPTPLGGRTKWCAVGIANLPPFGDTDIAPVMIAATPLAAGDGWLMTNADMQREITKRAREIQQIEHLRDVKVVVDGTAIVTAYHSRRVPAMNGAPRVAGGTHDESDQSLADRARPGAGVYRGTTDGAAVARGRDA